MIYGKNAATFCQRRTDKFNPAEECRPLIPATEAEREVVHKNGTLVHKYLPELVLWIKALHEEHMIEGWRCVENVVIFNKGNDHGSA
ncbi:MAG: hypothetical protein B7Y56_03520 [Gallionellales bacterium 35-53-114]|nr:MAG: hypothetical protein B7Y56_03520 [Gallionellales bacterium 35-53-114]OYZ65174.1 MAG: hypothetical protein B7Y04_00680 [Gallionellales bacterium 24-53-125]OZB08081.1 MAG: hypothetical protein B7X61_11130 [Gallionellales bacterium 39-52-133]HQS59988.1 hypothetical protein [Gallionellaceae bacterium]HQS76630.1 hypothetical protein [Gallionellaceae bacterium]